MGSVNRDIREEQMGYTAMIDREFESYYKSEEIGWWLMLNENGFTDEMVLLLSKEERGEVSAAAAEIGFRSDPIAFCYQGNDVSLKKALNVVQIWSWLCSCTLVLVSFL
ncbi:hypothetical protein MKW98_009949 [Papaver atlanticum]|uniref:Uncharacterized protein n=1 Tax=Papaver atlanticum TaxID=357466 RepID=A0AAD4T3J4_9MAGN|nr:hypothetical protein MKW98_009949 [Papaver atlanticum]